MSARDRDRQETGNKSSPLGVSRASAPTAPSSDPAERAGVSGPEVVVVAAARQEVRGSRQSPSGCTAHRTVEEGWGAALLSRPLDHASLHARAGVRDTGMSRGRGREACVRTSGRGVVCREQWPSGSNRRIGANELWPARIVAMAVGTMTPTTPAIPGLVSMHLPDGPQPCRRAQQPRPSAPTSPPLRTAPRSR